MATISSALEVTGSISLEEEELKAKLYKLLTLADGVATLNGWLTEYQSHSEDTRTEDRFIIRKEKVAMTPTLILTVCEGVCIDVEEHHVRYVLITHTTDRERSCREITEEILKYSADAPAMLPRLTITDHLILTIHECGARDWPKLHECEGQDWPILHAEPVGKYSLPRPLPCPADWVKVAVSWLEPITKSYVEELEAGREPTTALLC